MNLCALSFVVPSHIHHRLFDCSILRGSWSLQSTLFPCPFSTSFVFPCGAERPSFVPMPIQSASFECGSRCFALNSVGDVWSLISPPTHIQIILRRSSILCFFLRYALHFMPRLWSLFHIFFLFFSTAITEPSFLVVRALNQPIFVGHLNLLRCQRNIFTESLRPILVATFVPALAWRASFRRSLLLFVSYH